MHVLYVRASVPVSSWSLCILYTLRNKGTAEITFLLFKDQISHTVCALKVQLPNVFLWVQRVHFPSKKKKKKGKN